MIVFDAQLYFELFTYFKKRIRLEIDCYRSAEDAVLDKQNDDKQGRTDIDTYGINNIFMLPHHLFLSFLLCAPSMIMIFCLLLLIM